MKTILILLAATIGLFSINNAYAATCTWKGNTNSDWNTASNWQGSVPGANDDVVIGNGTAISNMPAIIWPNSGVCKTLSAGSSTAVTISLGFANLTVGGAITFGNAGVTLQSITGDNISGTSMTVGTGTYSFNDVDVIISGTITAGAGATITGNNTGTAINGVNLTTTGTLTLNPKGPVNISNLTTIASGATTISTTSQFTTLNMTVSGQTLNMNAPVTATGTVTTNTSSIVNSNTSGIFKANAISATGSTFALNAAATVNNALTAVNGTNTFTNTASTTAGSLALSAGTLNLGSTAMYMVTNVTGATTSASGTTLNLLANTSTTSTATLTTGSIATAGLVTETGTYTISNAGASSTMSGGITFNNVGYYLTFLGAGSTTITGATSMPGNDLITVGASGSGTTITFGAGATITSTASTGGGITNNANLNFTGTSGSGVTFSTNTPSTLITNNSTGTITAGYATMTFNGDNCKLINNGTFTGSNFTMNVQHVGTSTANLAGIDNSGTFTATTFNFVGSPVQYVGINNSGVFTVNGTSTITLPQLAGINNTGIFNAGSSGSVCTIDLAASAQGCFITNTGAVGKLAYFNLGPNSIINIKGFTSTYVTNSNTYSIFTLLSDANGSATIGTITSSGTPTNGYVGQFNVQRFLTGGGVSTTRGYRLLSSPVNSTAQYSSGAFPTVEANTNVLTLQNLNQSFTIYKTNYTTPVSFTGAATGGSGGSFTININNPSMYFYKEYLPNSNKTYTSGKNIGVTAIAGTGVSTLEGTTNNPTATIPVGNGYLLYFIGPGTRTNGSTSIAPADAVVTNVGFINQGQLQVNLFYTPYNGASAYTAAAGAGKLSYNSNLTAAQGGAGYNMVGNPYASTINLATVLTDNAASIDGIYLASLTSYIAYSANGTSAPASGFAVSGEGFLVHAKAAGGTLIFKESEKAPTQQLTGPALLMGKPKEDQPLTGLYMKLEKDSSSYEYCGIYFRNDWSDKFESGDALYLRGAGKVAMSSLTSNGIKAAINHMPDYVKGSRVKLSTEATTSGIYKLKIEDIRNIDPIFDIYLVDHYTKDSLDIRRYGSYAFNINTGDSTTFGANRFELVLRRKPLPPYTLNSFTGQKVTGNIKLTWNTSNEGNYTGFVLEKLDNATGQFNQLYSMQGDGSGSYSYTDTEPTTLGTNTYRLKQDNIDDQISYSDKVNVNFDINSLTNKNISVYPNPAKASIRVNIENGNTSSAAASYSTIIYNASGVAVSRKSESGSTWTQDVSNWGPGSYIIQIKDSKGTVTGQAKFTKVQ